MGLALKAAGALLIGVLAVRAAVPAAAQTPPRVTTRDKVYSKEQAARGEKQYNAVCASCHDPARVPEGKKPGPPLVGEKFLDKWQDRTLGELLTTIVTTMPNDGSAFLSDAESADVVAYLLQANGFPDGPSPFKPSDKEIVIVRQGDRQSSMIAHSYRSALIGSRREARRAGTRPARSATIASSAAAVVRTTGSRPLSS